MAIFARRMDVKLDPSNHTAQTSRQGGCTDMASWCSIRRIDGHQKNDKIYINTDWRDIANFQWFFCFNIVGSD